MRQGFLIKAFSASIALTASTVLGASSVLAQSSLGSCPYNVEETSESLRSSALGVINHYIGNFHLNYELAYAIERAKLISQDPRCEKEVNTRQLPSIIYQSESILRIGQKRLKDTTDRIERINSSY